MAWLPEGLKKQFDSENLGTQNQGVIDRFMGQRPESDVQSEPQQAEQPMQRPDFGSLVSGFASAWRGSGASTGDQETTADAQPAQDDGSSQFSLGSLASGFASAWRGDQPGAKPASGTPSAMPSAPTRGPGLSISTGQRVTGSPLRPGESVGSMTIVDGRDEDVAQRIAAAGTRASRYAPQIAQIAREEGVDPYGLAALMDTENSDESATSVQGARGIMQVVPGQNFDQPGEDASDPATSIRQGARAYREKARIAGGDWNEAGAAYFGYGTDALGNTTSGYRDKFLANKAKYGQDAPQARQDAPGAQTPASQSQRQPVGGSLDIGDVAQRYAGGTYTFGGGRDQYGGIPGAKDTDCSGFVSSVWRERGIDLPAHTDAAYSTLQQLGARQVSEQDAQPGDVVFYMGGGYGGNVTYHMGIYAGPGQVLDASRWNGDTGVKLRPLMHAGGPDDIVILRDPRVNGRVDPRASETPPPVKPTGIAESPIGERIVAQQAQPPSSLDAERDASQGRPWQASGGDMQRQPLSQEPELPAEQSFDPRDADQGLHEQPYPGTVTPIENDDGSRTTERSITVNDPGLNGGRATNIPTVWAGEVVSDDDAITNAINSGRRFPSYGSVDEAVAAAEQRTEDLGAGRVKSVAGAQPFDYDPRANDSGPHEATPGSLGTQPPVDPSNMPDPTMPGTVRPSDLPESARNNPNARPWLDAPKPTDAESATRAIVDSVVPRSQQTGGPSTIPGPDRWSPEGQPQPAPTTPVRDDWSTDGASSPSSPYAPRQAVPTLPGETGRAISEAVQGAQRSPSQQISPLAVLQAFQAVPFDVYQTAYNEAINAADSRHLEGTDPLAPFRAMGVQLPSWLDADKINPEGRPASVVLAGLLLSGVLPDPADPYVAMAMRGAGRAAGAINRGVQTAARDALRPAERTVEEAATIPERTTAAGSKIAALTPTEQRQAIENVARLAEEQGVITPERAAAIRQQTADAFAESQAREQVAPTGSVVSARSERIADDIPSNDGQESNPASNRALPPPSEEAPIARPNAPDEAPIVEQSAVSSNNGGAQRALSSPESTSTAVRRETPGGDVRPAPLADESVAAPVAGDVAQPARVPDEAPSATVEPSTTAPKYDFSSTQLNLPEPVARRVRKFGESIPDRQLAEDGRETEIHLTTKYGLHTSDPEEIRRIAEGQGPITVTLGKTDVFPASEAGGSDVVMVRADSPELRDLNARLSQLPNGDTHPEFNPHITVAYVKPGRGRQYAGSRQFDGQKVTIDRLTFSDRNGEQIEIPLTGRPTARSNSADILDAEAKSPPGQTGVGRPVETADPLTVGESPAAPEWGQQRLSPSEAGSVVDYLAGRHGNLNSSALPAKLAGLSRDEAADYLRGTAARNLEAPAARAFDAEVQDALTYAERQTSGRLADPSMERGGYGRRYGPDDVDNSTLAYPIAEGRQTGSGYAPSPDGGPTISMDEGGRLTSSRPLDVDEGRIPRTVDDAPRDGSINLNSAGTGAAIGAASGDEDESDDERLARAGMGAVIGAVTHGRGRKASRPGQSANPHIRDLDRQMRGDYKTRKGQRPLGERIVAALTDRFAIAGNVEKEIQGLVVASGGPAPVTRLAERVRVNPNSIAAQRAREELAPALEKVGEDADWLEQYLVHTHNLDVARGKAQEAYDEAIAKGRTPARAQQIANRVRASRMFSGGLTERDTVRAISDMMTEMGPARSRVVVDAAQSFWDANRQTLQRKLDAGMLDQQRFNTLTTRYPHYVRTDIADYFEGGPSAPTPAGKTMGVSDIGIKAISREGTSKDRVNPILSTIDSIYAGEQAIVRQQAGQDLVTLRDADKDARDLFKEVKAGKPTSETVPADYSLRNGEQKLTVWDNGKARQFVVPSEYAQLLTPNPGGLLGETASPLRTFFQIWKDTITTHNPGFQMVVSPMRDLGDYAVGEATRSATAAGPLGAAQAIGATPGVLVDYVRALPAAFEGLGQNRVSREVADLRRAGAGFEGRPMRTDKALREAYRGLKDTGGIALDSPADVLRAARTVLTLGAEPIGSRLEMVPRIAAARRAAQRGADEMGQAMAYKDSTVDFLRGGWLSRQLNAVVPFLNPTLQGGAQVGRLAKKNPAAFAAALGASVGVPAMLADAWNRSDEDRARRYSDLPDYVKNGGITWMLPEAFDGTTELGEKKPNYFWWPLGSFAFAARLAREGLALADPLTGLTPNEPKTGEEDGGGVADHVIGAVKTGVELLSMFSPVKGDDMASSIASLIPPVASETMEVGFDKDFYRGNQIATDRRDESASSLSHGVAEGLNAVLGTDRVRPSQVEHWTRGVGGYGATLAHSASDMVTGRSSGETRPIQDTPVVGGLINRVVRDTVGQRLENARDDSARVPSRIRSIINAADMRADEVTAVPNRYKGALITRAEQEKWQKATNRLIAEHITDARDHPDWDERTKRQELIRKAITKAKQEAAQDALDITSADARDRTDQEESRKQRRR